MTHLVKFNQLMPSKSAQCWIEGSFDERDFSYVRCLSLVSDCEARFPASESHTGFHYRGRDKMSLPGVYGS
jgi:hypothetical protein